MPLALANYSGGIIVTDWYNDGDAINESVKISIRFLSNEIRSDALAIKVFIKIARFNRVAELQINLVRYQTNL